MHSDSEIPALNPTQTIQHSNSENLFQFKKKIANIKLRAYLPNIISTYINLEQSQQITHNKKMPFRRTHSLSKINVNNKLYENILAYRTVCVFVQFLSFCRSSYIVRPTEDSKKRKYSTYTG